MLREEGGVGAYGFLLSVPEKFLERRGSGETGGWRAQGTERLREEKAKNPKLTASTLPPSSHDQSKPHSPPRPSRQGKKHGDHSSRSFLYLCPAPEAPHHREKGEGSGER